MPGGIMNLISVGAQNIILNGNPKKTFFKSTFNKYTNFGFQQFRLDYDGQRVLNYRSESVFKFKIPRYADLLNDVYVVINLPDIWSSIYVNGTDASLNEVLPYDFKWIEELGTNMIRDIKILLGGQVINQYSGEYISMIKERDFNRTKKNLFNKMIGNINEIKDPGNSNGNINAYPTAYWYNIGDESDPSIVHKNEEPSIRGRKLFIPIETWFTQSSKMAFPLVSLQYMEMHIEVTFRPIYELYMIRDVTSDISSNRTNYIAPNPNNDFHSLYRFTQPPSIPTDLCGNVVTNNVYELKRNDWNADIHLQATYTFLDEPERNIFAKHEQKYVLRLPHENNFLNVAGSQIVELKSRDLVSNYLWRFRRSDCNLRNVWSNYTNYKYKNKDILIPVVYNNQLIYFSSGNESIENRKDILVDLAIVVDGKYRENLLDSGTYNYIEKYNRTSGNAKDGLYLYNFSVNSNLRDLQPSGAFNTNKYTNINLEFNTITPPIDLSGVNVNIICDNGVPIGVDKDVTQIYQYNYDLKVIEERYNVLVFTGGMAGLQFAR
jgi:hypothetical protein